MEGFAEVYGRYENIPDDIEKMVKSRSVVDTVQRTTRRKNRLQDMSPDELKEERCKNKERKQKRKDNMTPDELQEMKDANDAYQVAHRENKRSQMTSLTCMCADMSISFHPNLRDTVNGG
jgi:hypothetical protein